jgi:hypothetical protein
VRPVLRAWRDLTLRQWLAAAACGAFVIVIGLSENGWYITRLAPRVIATYMGVFAGWGLLFLMAVAAADAIGSGRWLRYVVGCVAAALVCSGTAWAMRATSLAAFVGLPPVTPFAALYGGFFSPLVFGLLATLVYVRVRDSRRAALALHEAQRTAGEARLAAAEMQMRAAQEALEPQLVIRSLREIESLYETDPARAGARLDDLAAHLRSTIPRAG